MDAAAAAKSLQLCPILCDSIDSSPTGSAVPGILVSLKMFLSFARAFWLKPQRSMQKTPWFHEEQADVMLNYLPHDLSFLNVKLKPPFSHSSFTFIKRLFSSSSLSPVKVVSSAYLRLLIFLLEILIPAYSSSSPAFHMMYSAYMEKAMAPHSSTLAWKSPWMEKSGRLQSMGSLRIGHDWVTSLSLFTFMHWRRKWQPTPVVLPIESQGRGSLVGCRLWGRTESDTTEVT